MSKGLIAGIVVAVLAIIVFASSAFIVTELEQVIIVRLGKPVGDAIADPGLHFKVPVIDTARKFDRRWLEWDGDRNEMPTKDKKFIFVDMYARWRIADPLLYFQRVRDERGAQSRLDDVIDGATRSTIASYALIEVVRSSNRKFEVSEELQEIVGDPEEFQIQVGREKIAEEILEKAAAVTPEFGIELVDVRLKRVDYIETVRQKVYDRMISERQRIAEQNRSEGQGRSAEIRGQMERELKRIRSEAFKTAEELRGDADGKAAKIYAEAYSRDEEFYGFVKTLETWEKTLAKDTQLILSTDTDLFAPLKRAR
jgi:membrane protease subunit HflC